MMTKQGFTLVEILLAVMIVGIIGLSLAAITTAALRESGVARTRLILRNQLSVAMRQLRQDIQQASKIKAEGQTLTLEFENSQKAGPTLPQDLPRQVQYTYDGESETKAPGNKYPDAKIGGKIYRSVYKTGTVADEKKLWLDNIKWISVNGDINHPDYPAFIGGEDSRIRVKIIVQSNSFPVVNEVFDETFYTPHGVLTCDPYAMTKPDECGTI